MRVCVCVYTRVCVCVCVCVRVRVRVRAHTRKASILGTISELQKVMQNQTDQLMYLHLFGYPSHWVCVCLNPLHMVLYFLWDLIFLSAVYNWIYSTCKFDGIGLFGVSR